MKHIFFFLLFLWTVAAGSQATGGNVDSDLVANPVNGQITCPGTDFAPITFAATDHGTTVTAAYRVEFVGGDNILTNTGPVANNPWTPVADKAGKGVYRAVPIYNNREGVPALFSLEAKPHINAPETWEGDYGKGVPQEVFSPCTGTSITLTAPVSAPGLRYRWYREQDRIEGATEATYIITEVRASHAGFYHVIIMNVCEVIATQTFLIEPRLNIVSQKWSNVMSVNTDTETNGGIAIVPGSFEWYSVDLATGVNTLLMRENKSYIRVAGSVEGKTYSVSFLTTEGIRYESCPVTGVGAPRVQVRVYPNPVRNSEDLTVRIEADATDLRNSNIRLISPSGNVLHEVNSPEEYTYIAMPSVPGIYIVRVFIGNSIQPEELKVIVK